MQEDQSLKSLYPTLEMFIFFLFYTNGKPTLSFSLYHYYLTIFITIYIICFLEKNKLILDHLEIIYF